MENMELSKSDVMILHLTPEIAKQLLARNYKGNRNKKPKKIREFNGHINNGCWNPYVGDLLRITKDGTLIDGQNRCHAVIDSGKAIDVLFYDQFEKRDFGLCDGGSARTKSDVVGDIPNRNNSAALINLVLSTSRFGLTHNAFNKNAVSNRDIVEFIDKYGHDKINDAVNAAYKIKRACGGGSTSVYAWLYVTTQIIDNNKSDIFFDHMASDLVSIPAVSAYRRLISKSKSIRGKMTAVPTLLALLPIWNAIYQGHELEKLYMQTTPKMYGYWQGCELKYFE